MNYFQRPPGVYSWSAKDTARLDEIRSIIKRHAWYIDDDARTEVATPKA
jgi:hypothetical protein